MKRIADFRDVLRFGWIIAITRIADQSIAGADRKHDLGEIWRERDHPLDMRRQRYVSTGVIFELLSRGNGFRLGRGSAGQRGREQQRECKAEKAFRLKVWRQKQSPAEAPASRKETGISGTENRTRVRPEHLARVLRGCKASGRSPG